MALAKKLLLPIIVFLSLSGTVLVQYWGYDRPPLGIDDANIYFVYMKNLAGGHGFVWNVGGERVEGFTSLYWTLIGALAYKLSAAWFARILMGICFAFVYVTILQVIYFVRKLNGTQATLAASDIILLCVLLFPLGFIDWTVLSLMETGLWTFLLTTVSLLLARYFVSGKKVNTATFVLLLVLMDVTRPESLFFSAMFIALLFLIYWVDFDWRVALRRISVPLFFHAATAVSVIWWRISYFGFPFPNTYYAKVSANLANNIKAGSNYFLLFFYNYPLYLFAFVVLLGFTLYILLKAKRNNSLRALVVPEKIQVVLMVVILTGLLLPVITGGDHFKYNRFYQPIVPLLCAATCNQYCWKQFLGLSFPAKKYARIITLTAFAGMTFLSAKYSVLDFLASKRKVLHYPVIQDFIVSQSGRDIAEKMNETFEGDKAYPSVGAMATGGFAFIYKGNTIDLMGLNNVKMAHANREKIGYRNHASFDKNVFYQLMPDMMGAFYGADVVTDASSFILPENTTSFRTDYVNMVYAGYKQIYDDSLFCRTYQPVLLKNKQKDFFIFDYFSNDYLQRIDTFRYYVRILKRKNQVNPSPQNMHFLTSTILHNSPYPSPTLPARGL